MISVFPLSQLCSKILQWEKSSIKKTLKPLIRVLALSFFCFTPLLLTFFPIIIERNKEPGLLQQSDFINNLCLYLNDTQAFGDRPLRILASIYLGPVILYKTHHEVIGTPAHRNVSGILDTFAIMKARDDETAHQIIRERGINLILIGRPNNGLCDHFIPELETTEKFYYRLWHGPVPDWLEVLRLPMTLDRKVKVFMVKY
jgi:hypothetical protein